MAERLRSTNKTDDDEANTFRGYSRLGGEPGEARKQPHASRPSSPARLIHPQTLSASIKSHPPPHVPLLRNIYNATLTVIPKFWNRIHFYKTLPTPSRDTLELKIKTSYGTGTLRPFLYIEQTTCMYPPSYGYSMVVPRTHHFGTHMTLHMHDISNPSNQALPYHKHCEMTRSFCFELLLTCLSPSSTALQAEAIALADPMPITTSLRDCQSSNGANRSRECHLHHQ